MQTVSGIEPSGNNQNGHGFIFSLILVLGGLVEWVGGAGAGELKRRLGSL